MVDEEAIRDFCQIRYCRKESALLYRGIGICTGHNASVPSDEDMDTWVLKNARPEASKIAKLNGATKKPKKRKRSQTQGWLDLIGDTRKKKRKRVRLEEAPKKKRRRTRLFD